MHPTLPLNQILIGHAPDLLKTLPDESVHCVVTSPPYWGLRSYGTDPQVWQNGHEPCVEHQWGDEKILREADGFRRMKWETGGDPATKREPQKPSQGCVCSLCGAWRGELGLEPTPEMYVAHLVEIFREVRRVLRDDGTLWVNLGDSYASQGGPLKYDINSIMGGKSEVQDYQVTRKAPPGLKPKDLVGIPWMVAFALRADGWYLRSDIIWSKPNPMPESVTDRPTKSHEYIFLLSKSQRYYYDADAVREPMSEATKERDKSKFNGAFKGQFRGTPNENRWQDGRPIEEPHFYNEAGRNRRTVWTVSTKPFSGAHFATFPPKLIEPCILAGCPVNGVVLDPFIGSGTTASVCISLKRNYIGFDLNPAYVEGLAQDRADNTPPPLFVL